MTATKGEFLAYLLRGISYEHASNWRRDIERRKGLEAGNEFKEWVNKINNKGIL